MAAVIYSTSAWELAGLGVLMGWLGRVWGRQAGSAGEYGDGGGAVYSVCAGGVLYGRFRQSKSTKFLGRLFIAIMIPLGNFGPRLAEETSRPSVESVEVSMTLTSFE